MKTLWDAIDAGEFDGPALIELAPKYWHLDPGQNQVRPSMTVAAPCCGRKTSADVVIDVRAVAGTWSGGWRRPRLARHDSRRDHRGS